MIDVLSFDVGMNVQRIHCKGVIQYAPETKAFNHLDTSGTGTRYTDVC